MAWYWAWLGAALASLPAVGGTDVRPTYLEVARLYASGEYKAAVAALGRFSRAELSSEIATLRERARAATCAGCPALKDPPPLRAIILLHADRDDFESHSAEGTAQMPPCGIRTHEELADRAAALLQEDPSGRDFVRRASLAMALRDLGRGCAVDAKGWVKTGLKSSPGDTDLLFARGVIEEAAGAATGQLGRVDAPIPPSLEEAGLAAAKARRVHFEEARKAFERVLAADSTRDEARLHLASTHFSLDRAAEARRILEELLDRSPRQEVAYLAHLFLGRVHEAERRPGAAKEEYTLAFGLDPAGQSATIALSHTLLMSGEADEARTVVESALQRARVRTRPDPLWVYSLGPSSLHAGMFEQLREEAGR
jgi:tetratricopeptide (TPR) repeat protein